MLLVLSDYAHPETNEAWPSQNTLASVCMMTERTVINCLQGLERNGYITRLQRGNQHQLSVYLINVGAEAQIRVSETGASETVSLTPAPAEAQIHVSETGASEQVKPRQVHVKPDASVSEIPVGTNRHETSLEPSLRLNAPAEFLKGFTALEDIPKYSRTPQRDESLTLWLKDNAITGDVFFRAATSLAGNWPPRTSKNPDPWLSVRRYCLNQKQWDAERGSNSRGPSRQGAASLHDRRMELERGTPELREPRRP